MLLGRNAGSESQTGASAVTSQRLKLERLWFVHWYKDYVLPNQRPPLAGALSAPQSGLLLAYESARPVALLLTQNNQPIRWRGRMQLSWGYGTLQSSTNVAGLYHAMTNAISPLTVLMTNSLMFYRVQEQ